MPCAALAISSSSLFSSPPVYSPRSKTPSSVEQSLLSFNKQIASGQCLGSSAVALKKFRPPMLDVTETKAEVGWSLAVEPLGTEEVQVEGDGYSVYCRRGKKRSMEDRYCAVVDPNGQYHEAFFGVFDGHGGSKAAEFAARKLNNNITTVLSSSNCLNTEKAVSDGYLKTDAQFLEKGVNGGTCCVTALIKDGNLVVSNLGDCRAVISRGGVADALTVDHQPWREDEQDRIQALGGYVDCCNGVWRVQGTLAVTRGIGDRCLKKWVIAEPQTKIVRIDRESEFLILASDGLWSKISNQEAVDIIRSLCINVDKADPLLACKKLTDLSSRRGCSDDTSIMIVQLNCFLH